jgi:hypothetical protein
MTTVGVLVAGSLLVASSAFAADPSTPNVTQTVTAGTMTASATSITLGDVVTAHTVVDATGSMDFSADDSTGAGAGWTASEAMTDLIPVSTDPAGAIPIPVGDITITTGALTSGLGEGATGVTPAGTITLSTDETTILSATPEDGMGAYTLAPALSVAIPADTYAGAYTGTLTTTIAPLTAQ